MLLTPGLEVGASSWQQGPAVHLMLLTPGLEVSQREGVQGLRFCPLGFGRYELHPVKPFISHHLLSFNHICRRNRKWSPHKPSETHPDPLSRRKTIH